MSLSDKFELCDAYIRSLPDSGPLSPSNKQKLYMYALYKQVRQGDCNTSCPSIFNVVGRHKWFAWDKLRGKSRESAMAEYVEAVVQAAKSIKETDIDASQRRSLRTFLAAVAEKPPAAAAAAEKQADGGGDEKTAAAAAASSSSSKANDAQQSNGNESEDGVMVERQSRTRSNGQDEQKKKKKKKGGSGRPAQSDNDDGGEADNPITPGAGLLNERVASLKDQSDAGVSKLAELERRQERLLQTLTERYDDIDDDLPDDADEDDEDDYISVRNDIGMFREELKELLVSLEQRIAAKEREYHMAEEKWSSQLEQVEHLQRQLLSKLRAANGADVGQSSGNNGQQRSSSSSSSSWLSSSLDAMKVLVPIGVAGFMLHRYGRRKHLW